MVKATILEVVDEDSIGVVEGLARQIWREHYTPILGEKQVAYMLNKFQSRQAIAQQIAEGFLYYLIRDPKKEFVGYFGIVPKDNELFLSKLYVAAEFRGEGYGKYAIKFIETMAQKRGFPKIGLAVNQRNTNSIAAYKKCGFIVACPILQDFGNGYVMDDYKMEKAVRGLESV